MIHVRSAGRQTPRLKVEPGKAYIVMDGQWGSCGKGKVAAWLADKAHADNFSVAVCDFPPNAGHTWLTDNGTRHVVKQIPISAAVDPNMEIFIGPGAMLEPDVFLEEVGWYDVAERLRIHEHAGILRPEHAEVEKVTLRRISSTLKGCGRALASKIMREDDSVAKNEPRISPYCLTATEYVNALCDRMENGASVLVESSQGFDLSLDHGYDYPYCTSRNITPAAILDRCGIPLRYHGGTLGVLRAFPIRVGSLEGATSGPCYSDQYEMTWKEISEGAGEDVIERTTVTNRVRRVFSFSFQQLDRFLALCDPTDLYVNFVNYWGKREDGSSSSSLPLSKLGKEELEGIEEHLRFEYGRHWPSRVKPYIVGIGYGAKDEETMWDEDIGGLIECDG